MRHHWEVKWPVPGWNRPLNVWTTVLANVRKSWRQHRRLNFQVFEIPAVIRDDQEDFALVNYVVRRMAKIYEKNRDDHRMA